MLLPLTGQQADQGRKLEAAARQVLMAGRSTRIDLRVFDTQASAAGARTAAQQAVDAKAGLVLGPLYSVAAYGARSVLGPAGIPALSFSNNRAVAGNGLYLLGHLPGQQTETMLRYAAAEGHGTVVVVGPDTAYARLAMDTVNDMARTGAVQLLGSKLYPVDTDYNSQVSIVRDLAKRQPKAVVLPTTGMPLIGLSALFDYYDARPPEVRMVGTDLWEWPGTFKEISLRGSWYVSSNTPPVADPMAEPEDGTSPGAIGGSNDDPVASDSSAGGAITPVPSMTPTDAGTAAENTDDTQPAQPTIRLSVGPGKLDRLVMDAVALAASWAEHAQPNADPRAFLTDAAGFHGFSGVFRLLPSGLNEHALNILEVTPRGPSVIQPAPSAFLPNRSPTVLLTAADLQAQPWLTSEMDPATIPTGFEPTTPSDNRPQDQRLQDWMTPSSDPTAPITGPGADDTTVWHQAPSAPPVHAPADPTPVRQASTDTMASPSATTDPTRRGAWPASTPSTPAQPTWTQAMGIPTAPNTGWPPASTGTMVQTQRARDPATTLPAGPYSHPPYALASETSGTSGLSPNVVASGPQGIATPTSTEASYTIPATTSTVVVTHPQAPTAKAAGSSTGSSRTSRGPSAGIPPAPSLTAPAPQATPQATPQAIPQAIPQPSPTTPPIATTTEPIPPAGGGSLPMAKACSWQLLCTDTACRRVQVCPIDS